MPIPFIRESFFSDRLRTDPAAFFKRLGITYHPVVDLIRLHLLKKAFLRNPVAGSDPLKFSLLVIWGTEFKGMRERFLLTYSPAGPHLFALSESVVATQVPNDKVVDYEAFTCQDRKLFRDLWTGIEEIGIGIRELLELSRTLRK